MTQFKVGDKVLARNEEGIITFIRQIDGILYVKLPSFPLEWKVRPEDCELISNG